MARADGVRSVLTPEVWTVVSKRRDTQDIWTLTLERRGGHCAYSPGQFNMLGAFGNGEVPVSVSGGTGRKNQVIHTIRSVGMATQALVRLKKGDQLALRGPYGHGWPMGQLEGKDLVFIAGGLGLAPLRPAIVHALENREKYGQVYLLYGTREPKQILFRNELNRWIRRSDIHVEITVDRGDKEWLGPVGVVTPLLERVVIDPEFAHSLVCGPEIMMRFVALELEARGVHRERIWLSMERNMKCAVGFCGHCQYGPTFICKEGPVYSLDKLDVWLTRKGV